MIKLKEPEYWKCLNEAAENLKIDDKIDDKANFRIIKLRKHILKIKEVHSFT